MPGLCRRSVTGAGALGPWPSPGAAHTLAPARSPARSVRLSLARSRRGQRRQLHRGSGAPGGRGEKEDATGSAQRRATASSAFPSSCSSSAAPSSSSSSSSFSSTSSPRRRRRRCRLLLLLLLPPPPPPPLPLLVPPPPLPPLLQLHPGNSDATAFGKHRQFPPSRSSPSASSVSPPFPVPERRTRRTSPLRDPSAPSGSAASLPMRTSSSSFLSPLPLRPCASPRSAPEASGRLLCVSEGSLSCCGSGAPRSSIPASRRGGGCPRRRGCSNRAKQALHLEVVPGLKELDFCWAMLTVDIPGTPSLAGNREQD
ncbi:uncharacterized protein [Notamacropus eugenii]|uniref:uncharacterized protein n=1 Tax=Notamacropus eugenii TaxID=9315 RepID=UPI003B67EFED